MTRLTELVSLTRVTLTSDKLDTVSGDTLTSKTIKSTGTGVTVRHPTDDRDDPDDGRLTFIDDQNNSHEADGFRVTDHEQNRGVSVMRVTISDENVPDSLHGTALSTLQQWDVVVTHDEETMTGVVSEAQRGASMAELTITLDP